MWLSACGMALGKEPQKRLRLNRRALASWARCWVCWHCLDSLAQVERTTQSRELGNKIKHTCGILWLIEAHSVDILSTGSALGLTITAVHLHTTAMLRHGLSLLHCSSAWELIRPAGMALKPWAPPCARNHRGGSRLRCERVRNARPWKKSSAGGTGLQHDPHQILYGGRFYNSLWRPETP